MVSIKLDSYSWKLNNLDSLSFFEIFCFLVLGGEEVYWASSEEATSHLWS